MQEELYNRFSGKMYAVCLRYANNADDAQDLLQEGFIKVYRNLHRFRAEGSFEGWIRRVFVNSSIEHFRKKSLQLSKVSDKEESTIEDNDISALDSLAEKDIIKLIQDLSPGYRTVFNLYVVEGFSHKEIGEQLGISEGTCKGKIDLTEKSFTVFKRYKKIFYAVIKCQVHYKISFINTKLRLLHLYGKRFLCGLMMNLFPATAKYPPGLKKHHSTLPLLPGIKFPPH
jgi:RNA polymerase sigma-70 factor (ECF subfamily)